MTYTTKQGYYQIKKGSLPSLTVTTLNDADLTVVTVYDVADNVKFFMKKREATTTSVNGAVASMLTPYANGQLRYQFSSGQTNTVGVYDAYFQLLSSSTVVGSVPSVGYLEIEIVDNLS